MEVKIPLPEDNTAGARPGNRATAGLPTGRLLRLPIPRPTYRDLGRVATVLTLVALLLVIIQGGWAGRNQVAYNQYNLFRLHVRANSDDPADQAQKLRVRDAILEAFGPAIGGLADSRAAEVYARDHLSEIIAVASRAAAANGPAYVVEATVGTSLFPTRTYGAVVVPAGLYPSLQVAIGRGEGQNWWCVLFPPLCLTDLAARVDQGATIADTGPAAVPTFRLEPFTEGEVAVLAEAAESQKLPVELRWKVLEWARAARTGARVLLARLTGTTGQSPAP